MEKIPPSLKATLYSVAPFVAFLILFSVAYRLGMDKVSEMRTKLKAARNSVELLSQKVTVLETTDATADNSNLAMSALPDRNSSMVVISQLRIMASSRGIILSNIKGGAEIKDPNGLSRVDITFDALGTRPQILAFAGEIPKIAPITLLDKIKINESASGVRGGLQVRSYWSEMPAKLPAVIDKAENLTPAEEKLLDELSGLTQPLFIEDLPPQETGGKAEPFQ